MDTSVDSITSATQRITIDTTTIHKTEEESRKDVIKESILKKKFKCLSKRDFQNVLDEDGGEAAFHIAHALSFGEGEMRKIWLSQSGGGLPHARFVDLLCTEDHSIDRILEELHAMRNTKAHDILDGIKTNKGYEQFNELEPRESSRLYAPLYENTKLAGAQGTSWRSLAEHLGMDEIISLIDSTKAQGGVYSAGNAVIRVLNTKNPTISFVRDKLTEINNDKTFYEELDIQNVIDAFEECIDFKVGTEIKKENDESDRKRKRQDRKQAKDLL